jgi:hypothetical protein
MEHGRGFAECDVCHRHVRGGESTCPFCRAEIVAAIRPIATTPGAWPARAALLAGALVAGCNAGRSQPSYGFAGDPMEAYAGDASGGAAGDAPSLSLSDAEATQPTDADTADAADASDASDTADGDAADANEDLDAMGLADGADADGSASDP